MATNGHDQDRKKAKDLQKALEIQLLALEKLGALPTPAADEVRNVIAEGIAEKFGEGYRTFPCAREGTEIRRDAVPKQCALRKSVEGFVACNEARSSEKMSKKKGEDGQRKVVVKTTTEEEQETSHALANVGTAQRELRCTIEHTARYEKTAPHKTASPEKQLPKTSPSPSNPTKDGTSNTWYQIGLESGRPGWDAFFARTAAENGTIDRAGYQQKPFTQGTGSSIAPVDQGAGFGPREDGWAVAAAAPKDGANAPKTTGKPAEPTCKPPSSGEASVDSDEDLMDFGF